ncbi:MAG: translation initiation factor IF-1 [Candidatus Portnoybacteria bacterium RBG_13_41_18]|uniref:Translation initiation factor IF-1 n=1 Tax=Candidatus Portnoybacteria bacterium RBG_13_41_18 TaxID=1801991 RepID=A0A1G2F6G0_9BACT|nr:MAG: translation initiation factor IF-1 [Candidatus Portnoybacteria bacterium RBG_13_41_18]
MNEKGKIIKIGEVIEALPSTLFKVKTEEGVEILAHLSGRMRLNYIRILPGDRVKVELSQYDQNRGRIIQRL